MRKLNTRKILSITLLVAMMISLFPYYADAESVLDSEIAEQELPIVVNDPDFDPTVNAPPLTDIPWERVHSSGFDRAFTEALSIELGNGSYYRVQFLDENRIRFFGNDRIAHLDHLYYEEADSAEKQISFEIEQDQIHWHTMNSFGFFINMVRHDDDTVSGYALSIERRHVRLRMLNRVNISALQISGGNAALTWPIVNEHAVDTGEGDRYVVSITAEERRFAIDIQHIRLDADLPNIQFAIDLETAEPSQIPSDDYTGGNDFGLFSAYSPHNCRRLSYTTFSNVQIITRTVLPQGEVNVNFINADTINDDDPTTIADTYVGEGFVGQVFTINPPERIGNYIYVGSSEEVLRGVYSEELTTVNLLYAIITHNVTFDLQGGGVATDFPIQSVAYEAFATRPSDPIREGYNFLGWFTSATGDDEFNFEETPIIEGTMIYAQWERIEHTVTFNLHGGTGDFPSLSVLHGDLVIEPTTDPIREGYNFLGWFTTPVNGEEFDFDGVPIVENTVIHAQWERIEYTVTFNLHGGTGDFPSQSVRSGDLVTEPSANPTRIGYSFLGWFTAADSDVEFDFDIPITTDTVIHAQWEREVSNETEAPREPETPNRPGTPPNRPETPNQTEASSQQSETSSRPSLPQTGAAVGFSALGGSILLVSGLAISAKKKR